jgi:hypothetical protein
MFLGLLDPVPLVRGMDPDRILLSSSKNSKKTLDSYCFVISFWLFVFEKWKNDVNVPSKSNKQKNFFIGLLKVNDENRSIS